MKRGFGFIITSFVSAGVSLAVYACGSVPDPTFVDVDGGLDAGKSEGGGGGDARADGTTPPPPPPPSGCPTSPPSGTICCGSTPCVGCATSECTDCSALSCPTDQVCCRKPGMTGGFNCKPLSACH